MSSADAVQMGGDHYKQGGRLQHWNMVAANGLGYFEAAATKYVTRWRKKAGLLDLEKAGHYHDKLIELAEVGAACPAQTHRARPYLGMDISRRAMDRVDMGEYAEANGLGALESAYCTLMVEWSDTADLQQLKFARAVLRELVETEQASNRERRAFN